MPKSEYTKGPWEINEEDGFIRQIGNERLWIAHTILIPYTQGGIEATQANAGLIAAAPETWEMLNEVVNGGYLDGSPEQKRRVVDFLICKAVGK